MQKIVTALESAILDGQYPPNCRLPSERQLVKRFKVPVRAAREAVDVLEERGLVYRIERGGTFIRSPDDQSTTPAGQVALKCVNFIEPLRSQTDPFAFALTNYLHGYTRILQNRALRIQFVSLPGSETQFETVLNPALPSEGQGCILGDLISKELMEWLQARNIPYVIRRFAFYDDHHLPKHFGVYLNRNGASHKATSYLMELGHTRIGYIGQIPGEEDHSPWLLNWCWCYDGYRSAFCVAGRQVNPDHQANVAGGSIEEAAQAATRLLKLSERPTAIVCQNDFTAFGVIKAAQTIGLRVPDDLSVIGFDNDPAGAESNPPLTTFGGHEKLAVTAIEKLLEVADGANTDYGAHPIECPMIMRKSTARPAGA